MNQDDGRSNDGIGFSGQIPSDAVFTASQMTQILQAVCSLSLRLEQSRQTKIKVL